MCKWLQRGRRLCLDCHCHDCLICFMQQPSVSHTIWWGQHLPNGPLRAHSSEAIVPKFLRQGTSEVAAGCFWGWLKGIWKLPFAVVLRPIKGEKVRLWGKSSSQTVCAGVSRSNVPIRSQSGKRLKEKQQIMPESAPGRSPHIKMEIERLPKLRHNDHMSSSLQQRHNYRWPSSI